MTELPTKRTETSKLYDLGANKRRLVSTIHTQHYLDGQEYKDIDTYLVAKSETLEGEAFSHYCTKAPFEARLNRYKQPLFFKDKESGDVVLVRPIGANNVAGVKNNNTMYYPSIYPGLDIRRTVTPEGLKEEIIKVGTDIPDYLEFQVVGDFDKYARTPFVVVDKERVDFPYNIEGDRRILSLVKLRDMPIGTIIDPTLELQPDETAGKDARYYENQPDTNYGGTDILAYEGGGTDLWRSIIAFDISSIPAGSTIDLATFSLYKYGEFLGSEGKLTHVRRCTRTNWVETEITWNSYSSGNPWTTPGGDFTETDMVSSAIPANGNWQNWAITAQAQYGLDSASGLVSMIIRGDTVDLGHPRYWASDHSDPSLRPKFVVDYTEAAVGGKHLIDGFKSSLLKSVLVR